METIKEILMRRDELTEEEAKSEIEEAKRGLADYLRNGEMELAYNICEEYFGLEPDYIDELM